MFEKDLKIAYLLDFYGEVLTERKKEVLDMYYNEDLSLAEIAEQIGISRQGVRELELAGRMSALRRHTDNMISIAENEEISESLKKEIEEISKIIK